MVIGTSIWLKRVFPKATIFKYSSNVEADKIIYGRYGIIPVFRRNLSLSNPVTFLDPVYFSIHKLKHFIYHNRKLDNKKDILMHADIIIDISGDCIAQAHAFRRTFYANCYELLRPIVLGKPVVLAPQSIGPFENRLARGLATFILRRASFIMAREQITYDFLSNEMMLDRVRLVLDSGFEMPSASTERIREILYKERFEQDISGIVVGVTPDGIWPRFFNSLGADHLLEECINAVVTVIDRLIKNYGANIILIPHSTSTFNDDRPIIKKICSAVENRDKIKVFSGKYRPEEIKGIIGSCDIFIGGRMHACIAALSSYVPTVALSHSHKYFGIMEMLGQGSFVWDIMHPSISSLEEMVYALIENRNVISKELTQKLQELKKESTIVWNKIKNYLA
ncbi:colanic acid biosynthesis protein [Moorella thermoacetica]|nr:colanic acid biosynthesis protein [Moorella thermoacetica]